MLKNTFLFIAASLLWSCSRPEKVEMIVSNGRIYTVDSVFSMAEAMAIHGGIIVATGTDKEIKEKYEGDTLIDLGGKTVFPGFIDAHCHFLAYGVGLFKVNLVGTSSFEEVLERVKLFVGKKTEKQGSSDLDETNTAGWIIGRGWDQNDWEVKQMPDKHALDSLFPDQPVLLTRIDGHAVLVNTVALEKAGITARTRVPGGEVEIKKGEPTGILIDNAIDLVRKFIPDLSEAQKRRAMRQAQENCMRVGLTTVDDAGLMREDVELIDRMHQEKRLKIRVYAMLSDSAPNYRYYLEKGPYKTPLLNVRSFKFYGDGALGSRGACLHEPYNDKAGWNGFMLNDMAHFEKYASLLDKKGFQMNTHCIGDSAATALLRLYGRYCNGKNGSRRWRIEHAQVIHPDMFSSFNRDIIPSVQPTHATSDMYWLKERLGVKRSRNAYANKKLLQSAGVLALGTDFPVEDISPFRTFYAAVARKDEKGFPDSGFQVENALTREETLRGMTIWAAYANFEESEKGSLEKSKFADFIVLDRDIMQCEEKDILGTNVLATFISGEITYQSEQFVKNGDNLTSETERP